MSSLPDGSVRPKTRSSWPAALLLAGIGSLPLVGWVGGRHWLPNLLNHFQAQYFVILVVCCTLLLIRRRFRPALLAACLLTIPGLRLAPLWIPPAPSGDDAPLKIATFNVLGSNERHAETVAWLRREQPDFVYLCETTEEWTHALDALDVSLPHAINHPLDGSFGFVFRSRFPVREKEITLHGALGLPLLNVVLESPGGPVRVLGAHPVPPVSRFWAGEHAVYLDAVARTAEGSELPTVILGDLNSTPWCHRLRPIFDAGFRDSARGRGWSATWSRNNPLIALPIDHILSRGVGPCMSRQLGPDLGSDHRPVVAGFTFKP